MARGLAARACHQNRVAAGVAPCDHSSCCLDEAEPLKHEQRDPSSQTDGMNPILFTM